jgi:DNA-binding MarR family transcriptional regulator
METGAGTPVSASRNKRQVFDKRGRTIPWMARTVHRLYNGQAQKILDEENVTIAHWIYLRVLAERGELNQLELSKRVGMASTTAVPALDSMEKRGLLKRRRDPEDRRKYYVVLTDKGRSGRQAIAEDRRHDCRVAGRHQFGRNTHFLEGLTSYCKKSCRDDRRRSGIGLTE